MIRSALSSTCSGSATLEVLGGERLLVANDNNYPFSDGRWIVRDQPDEMELIVVRAPALG